MNSAFYAKLAEGAARAEEALLKDATNEKALRNLSDIYFWQGRLADAVPYYRKARYTIGASAKYQLLLGQLYWRLEDTLNAIQEFEIFGTTALSLSHFNEDNLFILDGAAWYAEALRWSGRVRDAHALAAALLKKGEAQRELVFPRLFYPLAGLLRATAEYEWAERLRRAAILRPDLADRRFINRQATGLLPDGMDEEGLVYLQDVSRGMRLVPEKPEAPPRQNRNGKIRAGFVCQELRDHPVGQYFRPLLQAYAAGHMKDIEIFLYNAGDEVPQDNVFAELRANAEGNYRLIKGKPLSEIADMIEKDGIDILFDLGGRSPRAASFIFEARLAPVQAMWLGWGHTSGNAGIDYLLVDDYCAPIDARYIHEKLAVLHAPYMQISHLPPAPVPPVKKNGYVTFGWPNRLDKITPEIIARDAEILRRVPDSRLLIMRPELHWDFIRDNIRKAFAMQGIEDGRIEFSANSAETYLPELRRIDIVLDPAAVNGGATSLDALAAGVIAATEPGTQIYQRFTHSFLQWAGIPEWSFAGRTQFIEGVAARAQNKLGLIETRERLQAALPSSPLMDRKLYGRAFSELLQQLRR